MRFVPVLWPLTVALALTGCPGPSHDSAPASAGQALPGPIVTAERGGGGGRLIVVGEDGRRMSELTPTGKNAAIDHHPVWSPDGNTIVFASSRGTGGITRTTLWAIEAKTGAMPYPLTSGAHYDRDPAWLPDGSALVFSSQRGGTLDLYRAPVTRERGRIRLGQPVRLTESPGKEMSAAVSPDGTTIVFGWIDENKGARIATVPVTGGAPTALTKGPLDVTPMYSPDGKRIAFAGPVKDRKDLDLYIMQADGSGRTRAVDEPLADETGPVYSKDGRLLFATAVFRSIKDGSAILSSVVVAELGTKKPAYRALHDPAGVESRVGVALRPAPLSPAALAGNRPYREALKRVIADYMLERQEQQRSGRTPDPIDSE